RDISQRRQAVIVEGYTDVMACHLAGITTAVATSGTSFGEGHIAILRRLLMDDSQLRGEVIFTFDGDAAGRRAALRAFSMEERFVTQTFVAVQSDGLDPCDLRLKEGEAAVRDLVASRVPLYEFAVRAALGDYDLESAEGRIGALDAAARIVARIKDHALRKVYAIKVDRWLGLMDEELVLQRIAEHIATGGRKPTGQRSGGRAAGPRTDVAGSSPGQADRAGKTADQEAGGAARAAPYDPFDPVINLERQALKLAIQRPALLGPAFDGMGAEVFTAPAHRAVRELISSCGGVAQAGPVREWIDRLLAAARTTTRGCS
ncbi:MAG TPA: toprim domain-containing protein, partial [Streptosporangiaceae bacterium]